MLPELRTKVGFDTLREAGYGFSPFDSPRQFKMQAEILGAAIETIDKLTTRPEIAEDTAYLVLDSLFRAPVGFEFFQRFPKEEVVQFCRLAVDSRKNLLPLPVVCPVCPDYEARGYKIHEGVGLAMERVFSGFGRMAEFFGKRNLPFSVEVHVADVEVLEPLILRAAGETRETFLDKTKKTITAISEKADRLGLGGIIRVNSMMNIFADTGLDYTALKQESKRKILEATGVNRKVRKAVENLISERIRLGDYDERIGTENFLEMAGEELADYATYGDLVNGQAAILSPDALSAVPAYNFLRSGQDGMLINPTIYLGKVKQRGGDLYA